MNIAQGFGRRDPRPPTPKKSTYQTITDISRLQPPDPQPNWALFLDVDGTLLDIADRPDRVVVPSTLVDLLKSLRSVFGGAVALVSGRPLSELDRLFSPLKLPAAGQHGAEWRHDTDAEIIYDPNVIISEELARQIIEIGLGLSGVLIEQKPASIALHYRNNPHVGLELHHRLANVIKSYQSAFDILPGKMVWEVKRHDINKGNAIRTLMKRPPFINRIPVVLGDDITDCDGFRAARKLAGHALAIGPLTLDDWPVVFPDSLSARHWLARLPEILDDAR